MTSYIQKQKRIKRLNFFRLSFFLLIFVSLVASLFIIKGLFITLLLAFILSFILSPPVNFLCRLGLHRNYSVSLVFSSFLIGVGGLLFWSLPFLSKQFKNLQEEFPNYIEQISVLMQKWQDHLENNFFFFSELNLFDRFTQFLSSFGQAFFTRDSLYYDSIFYYSFTSSFFCFLYYEEPLGFDSKPLSSCPQSCF